MLIFKPFRHLFLLSGIMLAATCTLYAQEEEMAVPDGISVISYMTGKAVVQEITPMPDFLDFKVDYVSARALGEEGKYGGLRFTRTGSSDLLPYGSTMGSGSIARGELVKAATILQQIVDELLNSKPSKRTVFSYASDEGLSIVGEYDKGRWQSFIRLTNYDMGTGTPLRTEDVRELVELLRKASKM